MQKHTKNPYVSLSYVSHLRRASTLDDLLFGEREKRRRKKDRERKRKGEEGKVESRSRKARGQDVSCQKGERVAPDASDRRVKDKNVKRRC